MCSVERRHSAGDLRSRSYQQNSCIYPQARGFLVLWHKYSASLTPGYTFGPCSGVYVLQLSPPIGAVLCPV